MINLPKLEALLISLADTAAKAILEIYQQSQTFTVQTKPDHTPLTKADLIAQDILYNGLKALTPNLPILSEEGSKPTWEERQTWTTYWLLDPLDGTAPFIARTGEFTVNIALIHHHVPVFGLVHVPITNECYLAYSEIGAYKIDAVKNRSKLSIHPWVAEKTHILTSHGAREEKIAQHFGHLGNYTVQKLSSSWKFCLLAEGKADISPRFGSTSEWDTAAGQCILEQAGGAILNLAGEPLRYNTHESLLNPHFIALGDAGRLRPKMFGKTS